MPGSKEFWGRLAEARERALSGDTQIAVSMLEDLRDNYPTGDKDIDAKRVALLEMIARTCNILFSGQRGASSTQRAAASSASARVELQALPGTAAGGEIVIDWSSETPVREEFYQEGKVIVLNHSALAVPEGAGCEAGILLSALDRARAAVASQGRADALVAYERYLDLICDRIGDPSLIGRATLLDGTRFEMALRRDPSQSFTLLGAALSRLRHGDVARGRHLLRRLASSGYPDRRLARRFLCQLVSERGAA